MKLLEKLDMRWNKAGTSRVAGGCFYAIIAIGKLKKTWLMGARTNPVGVPGMKSNPKHKLYTGRPQ
jgi:hypothetical protein